MNGNKKKSDGFLTKIIEGILYVIFVVIGFYLAFLIRFNMNPTLINFQPFYDSIPFIVFFSIIVFYMYEIVSTAKKTLFENAITIGISLMVIDVITVAIVFFNRGFTFPRSVFLIGFLVQYVLIFIVKMITLTIIKMKRIPQRIIVIAPEEEAEYITKKLLLDEFNFDSIKYIINEVSDKTYRLINDVNKIYVGNEMSDQDKLNIIRYCTEKNKTVYIVPGLFEIALVNSKVAQIKDLPFFKVESMGLTFEQKIIKRLLDVFISVIGLIVFLPFLTIIAMIIKLSDGGPVFYKQKRVTKNNQLFNLYKFRTMVVDAEKNVGPIMATKEDPRVTPIGRFLRSSRIDEFPQLFNVLKGDMSIVGPRPERPFFVKKINKQVDEFKYRVFVKAGITGLAQILGRYDTEPVNKVKYDLLYIREYSLFLDIKIIFNTIKKIFIKDSSCGLAKKKELDEIFKELNLNVYKEYGATRIE